MRSQVGPSSQLLPNLKAITNFMKEKDDLVILGFFDSDKETLYETYLEANNNLRNDHSFGHTFDAAAKKRFGLSQSSIVMVHPEKFQSSYEDPHIVFKVLTGFLLIHVCVCVCVWGGGVLQFSSLCKNKRTHQNLCRQAY